MLKKTMQYEKVVVNVARYTITLVALHPLHQFLYVSFSKRLN